MQKGERGRELEDHNREKEKEWKGEKGGGKREGRGKG